jgi:predicted transposase/invertase (TIGR01784 family)
MNRDFLPPKNDVVFRLLFGDKRNGDLLRDFLQSVLTLPANDFAEITIVDPHLFRKYPDKKLGILDLKAKTKSGTIIHIEIQLADFPQMRERIVFYDAGLITDQIDEGEEYGVIKRAITILIVDYVLISESPYYHNRFTLYDPSSAVEFTDLIEIHTLELPKLPETADNYLWHWLRFLRAESKEDLDMVAQASPKLGKVVVKLLKLSKEERARMLYEAQIKQERDDRARMRGAREEGLAEGKAKGKTEGLAEGEKRERIEIARKLLKMKLPLEQIVKATGLSCEAIENLCAGNRNRRRPTR